jgi:hypothetical protein
LIVQKERLREELERYLAVSAYLFVCFCSLLFLKAAALEQQGIEAVPLGLAAGKALILGKFILLGEAAGVGTRAQARTLLQVIWRKTILFMLLLVVLTVIEELLVGRVHGRAFAQTLAELASHKWPEVAARCVVLLLVLLPLMTITEISNALGHGTLRRALLGPAAPARSQAGEQSGAQ